MLKQHKFKVERNYYFESIECLSCNKIYIWRKFIIWTKKNYWMFKLHEIYIWRKIIIWVKKLL